MLTLSSSQEVVLGESFLAGASKAKATSAIAPTDGAPSVGSTLASETTAASAVTSSIAMTSSVPAVVDDFGDFNFNSSFNGCNNSFSGFESSGGEGFVVGSVDDSGGSDRDGDGEDGGRR